MGKAQRRKRDRRPPWSLPNWNGDSSDRYYAEELRAEGYGALRQRTRAEAERAWAIYWQPWATENDLRAINNALAPYWIPYIYQGELHGAVIRELVAVIDHTASLRVLDVGCGVGLDACFLAARYPTIKMCGSDLSPVMIERAQARARRRGLANTRFVVSAHRDLPTHFSEERFDLVYSHGSLLFSDPNHLRAHLVGVTGVLRTGGILLCEMPMEVNPHWFVSEIVEKMDLGFSLWTERGEIQTLSIDGREVCWCCVLQLEGDAHP